VDSAVPEVTASPKAVRGELLAFAGDTGPGGKRGVAPGPNVHRHVFFARKHARDGKRYFLDHYGIHSQRDYYPILSGTRFSMHTPVMGSRGLMEFRTCRERPTYKPTYRNK
jgi:hypothetical protein